MKFAVPAGHALVFSSPDGSLLDVPVIVEATREVDSPVER
jgi:hypothetical protein